MLLVIGTWLHSLCSKPTSQKQSVLCAVHLDLCIELAPSVLEPVPFINDDVLPLQLCQARPVALAHQEIIAGQQDIKLCLARDDLYTRTFAAYAQLHCR